MHRIGLALLLALSTAGPGGTQPKNAPLTSQGGVYASRAQLIGTWKLISRAVKLEDGTAVQDQGLGNAPKGYLMYDSSGHMAVQLMRVDRPLAIDCGTASSAASDNSPQILSGYEAYFGTDTVDEANHTVTHHLEGALTAADVGRNLVRQFQLSGDQLTIVVRTSLPREKQIRTLTWERVR